MKNLRLFRFKDVTVDSPDAISECIAQVKTVDEARLLIVRLANHITVGDTEHRHIQHACKVVLRICGVENVFISTAVMQIF